MATEAGGGTTVARRLTSSLQPALDATTGTTVGDLRRRLLEPDAPTAVVVRDPEPRVVDALVAIRSTLPDDAPATALVCCTPPLLSLSDDLDRILATALDRAEDHRGHDLLVDTEWGPRLLPVPVVAAIAVEDAALARQLDPLTGLLGRAGIHDAIEVALRRDPQTVAVAFLDLDRLEAINELHGHGVGDRVLQVVADRLMAAVRSRDTVGRVGGHEFVVVMEVTGPSEARMIAERLVETITEPVEQTTTMVSVGMSVGVALVGDDDATDAQRLIADADALMHLSRQRGGGVLVAGDLDDALVTRSQLAQALTSDTLQLQYQPIVPLDGRPSTAVEALVRWPTADGGTLQPSAFIPLAEATGQILDLDWWALERAVRQLAAWDRSSHEDTPRSVHVNLSALTLAMPGLVSHVERLLAMADLTPDRLTLELTETAVVTDIERARDVLAALDELGVRTAIDDFGIGQSSLAQLSSLPVSVLKIDRAFVRRLVENEVDRSVVRLVRALADQLGLDIVAEGVESMSQAVTLMDLGVTHAQGWLWSRAVDARVLGDDTEEVAVDEQLLQAPPPPPDLPPSALGPQVGAQVGAQGLVDGIPPPPPPVASLPATQHHAPAASDALLAPADVGPSPEPTDRDTDPVEDPPTDGTEDALQAALREITGGPATDVEPADVAGPDDGATADDRPDTRDDVPPQAAPAPPAPPRSRRSRAGLAEAAAEFAALADLRPDNDRG